MPTCRICLRDRRDLAYTTQHATICLQCVEGLNADPEPANFAESRLGDLLRTGMKRRDPNYTESQYQRALPGWLNRLLAEKNNKTRDFKIVRAHRRGLLRADGLRQWSYPADWTERARRIRARDRCCQDCGTSNAPLDVHHIIFLSNYGTNRQENLASLCRPCHEKVHGREFDFGEAEEPGNPAPIKPIEARKPKPPSAPISTQPFTSTAASARLSQPTQRWPPSPPMDPLAQNLPPDEKRQTPIDLVCPQCKTQLTAKLTTAVLAAQRVRCPSCSMVFSADDGLDHYVVPSSLDASLGQFDAEPKNSQEAVRQPQPAPATHHPEPPQPASQDQNAGAWAAYIFVLSFVLLGLLSVAAIR